jgi:hypothetical protein
MGFAFSPWQLFMLFGARLSIAILTRGAPQRNCHIKMEWLWNGESGARNRIATKAKSNTLYHGEAAPESIKRICRKADVHENPTIPGV